LRCRAHDADRPDLDGLFDSIEPELRLSISRRDTRSTAAELVATDALLFDLGFSTSLDPTQPTLTRDIPEGSPTRLGVSLRFGSAAVGALLDDLDNEIGWDVDMLNAAHL